MKVLEKDKKIIEDTLKIIYDKFNINSLNQIPSHINVDYSYLQLNH